MCRGGQFERLIGGTTLTWSELSEVLLDVETQINRRPLSYVEDDIELPTLTPATFLYQRTTQLPEDETWRGKDKDLRRRAKFLKTCKDSLWKRWQREYLRALRERHNLTHKISKFQPKEGDVVIVKADSKNRGTWPLAIIKEIYQGRMERSEELSSRPRMDSLNDLCSSYIRSNLNVITNQQRSNHN